MKYGLLRCYPVGDFRSSNECLAVCNATSFGDAVQTLQANCPVPLVDGYAKQDSNTFVVAEEFGS